MASIQTVRFLKMIRQGTERKEPGDGGFGLMDNFEFRGVDSPDDRLADPDSTNTTWPPR